MRTPMQARRHFTELWLRGVLSTIEYSAVEEELLNEEFRIKSHYFWRKMYGEKEPAVAY